MTGSEITANFTVNQITTNVTNYVPTNSFLSNYWSVVIGILVIMGIVYIVLKSKRKKKKVKRVSKRKNNLKCL